MLYWEAILGGYTEALYWGSLLGRFTGMHYLALAKANGGCMQKGRWIAAAMNADSGVYAGHGSMAWYMYCS